MPSVTTERNGDNKGRFVHYTSAENALKIINTRSVWLRNTTCMTDYREVSHGLDLLRHYFANDENKNAFVNALNECSVSIAEEAIALFDQWLQSIQLQTYISSISEHDDREDFHGRLSMWRAFGNTAARVAVVLRLGLETGKNYALACELSPVGYFTDAEIALEFANIRDNHDFLREIDRRLLLGSIFAMLTNAVVCLKHEGFREEREWRIIYSPARLTSPHIQTSIEVVGGVPQRVYKVPLHNNSQVGISGLELDELIDRIIIGPSQFPWAMYDAFVAALDAAGVKNANTRVFISQIPVRT
jgi:hypothetical protein